MEQENWDLGIFNDSICLLIWFEVVENVCSSFLLSRNKFNVCVEPFQTVINNLEEMQQNQSYRNNERGRSMGVGPMRSKPIERRHDTSPYSGVPYLSPPLPETWRRTNSDSALHQSSNECQGNSQHPHHRRGSDNTCEFESNLPSLCQILNFFNVLEW